MSSFEFAILPELIENELLVSYFARYSHLAAGKDENLLRATLRGGEKERLRVELFQKFVRYLIGNRYSISSLFSCCSPLAIDLRLNRGFSSETMLSDLTRCQASYRYCPQCALEDIQSYGQPILYRQHQLALYLACSKHKIMLREVGRPSRKRNELVLPHVISVGGAVFESAPRILLDVSNALEGAISEKSRVTGGQFYLVDYLSKQLSYLVRQTENISSEDREDIATRIREKRFKLCFYLAEQKGGIIVKTKRRKIEHSLEEMVGISVLVGVSDNVRKFLRTGVPTDASQLWIKHKQYASRLLHRSNGRFELVFPLKETASLEAVVDKLSRGGPDVQRCEIDAFSPAKGILRSHGVSLENPDCFVILCFDSDRASLWGDGVRH